MNRIVELILRTFSLLEAEGRAAKRNLLDLVAVTLIWALAACLTFVGALLVLTALYIALELIMPAPLAAAIVGGASVMIAALLRSTGKRYLAERSAERSNEHRGP